MNDASNKVIYIQPVTVERQCGGWLAVSPTNASVRIGVVGKTEDDAIAQFSLSTKRWADALNRANEWRPSK